MEFRRRVWSSTIRAIVTLLVVSILVHILFRLDPWDGWMSILGYD